MKANRVYKGCQMKFLTIGPHVVNMDLVTDMLVHADSIDIFFTTLAPQRDGPIQAPARDLAVRMVRVQGADAGALRRWIAQNAEDVSDHAEGSTGAPLGEPPPYVSPR